MELASWHRKIAFDLGLEKDDEGKNGRFVPSRITPIFKPP